MMRFLDRADAGRQLARQLAEKYPGIADGIVLGIPRGGVVVGAAVARQLHLPLDVLITKKIGAPGNEEYAIGAVGPDGSPMLDEPSFWTEEAVAHSIRVAQAMVRAYASQFSAGRLPNVHGKSVMVVDDGIATGRTMELGLRWLKTQQPARIILAAPVAAPDTLDRLRPLADDAIVVYIPPYLSAIGEFYDDFAPVSDQTVADLLKKTKHSGRLGAE